MIGFFGAGDASVLPPGDKPIPGLDPWGIWEGYIRYIGAGAVAAGGIITLVKSLPMLFSSLAATLSGLRRKEHEKVTLDRTHFDIPGFWVTIMIALLVIVIAFAPLTDFGHAKS